uniref:Uncharacterized protein n=1 Tax=Glossina pallidipes TaxID=7398 RepID=A0A1A9ZML2_GLOPL
MTTHLRHNIHVSHSAKIRQNAFRIVCCKRILRDIRGDVNVIKFQRSDQSSPDVWHDCSYLIIGQNLSSIRMHGREILDFAFRKAFAFEQQQAQIFMGPIGAIALSTNYTAFLAVSIDFVIAEEANDNANDLLFV